MFFVVFLGNLLFFVIQKLRLLKTNKLLSSSRQLFSFKKLLLYKSHVHKFMAYIHDYAFHYAFPKCLI